MDSDDASHAFVAVVTEEVSKFIFLIYVHIYSMVSSISQYAKSHI